jgi:hypothetical protein
VYKCTGLPMYNYLITNTYLHNSYANILYTYKFLFLKNTKISIFGGISKFHLWANFGKFWQFWANFAALTVADSMPQLRLKSLKPHNF